MANKYTGSDTGKGGLEVKKTTGTPDVRGVTEIQLDTNLTLTDNGNGGVTIQSSGGGGGSGVTSVGLTETGSALTITNSPITTSGDINIAGAGNSSQVILGDLTLGTLPTPDNPSATIGASANNGVATTFMRSDATPALETTGVAQGTYGSATEVGKFTVDATGRITGATSVAISGGGGGGGYPLFKHDETPTNTNFDPFRLWADGDTIELGVSSGGEGANADVSVFTPATNELGPTPSLAQITGIGNESTNTGREYVFYGDDYKRNLVQYVGGSATQTLPPSGKIPPPLYFVSSMRQVVSSPAVFEGNSNLVIYTATTDAGENPFPSTLEGVNCVRVIDAGTHLVLNGSADGGTDVAGGGSTPTEESNVRILLIVDAPPALFNGNLGVNYGLVPSILLPAGGGEGEEPPPEGEEPPPEKP